MALHPSVVVMVIDSLRGDCAPGADASPHLRALGVAAPTLPHMSRLVKGAWHFTRTYACSSYTTTCHASLFTGLLPPEHGVRTFHSHALNPEVRTLAEVLQSAGYATCAAIEEPYFFHRAGLLRGFQTEVHTDQDMFAWWDAYASLPKFLFMHTFDVHAPYGLCMERSQRASHHALAAEWEEHLRAEGIEVPARGTYSTTLGGMERVRELQVAWMAAKGLKASLQAYVAGLETFDRGRLAALLPQMEHRAMLDDCILVVTADHGEGRARQPKMPPLTHGTSVADDQIHIPLFMRVPRMPGRRVTDQVSQADIAPTVLDLLGLLSQRTPPWTAYSGRSLVPALNGKDLPDRPVYAETFLMYGSPFLSPQAGDDKPLRAPDILRFRCLRYPQRKFRLAGRVIGLNKALLTCSTDEFLTRLNQDLLARPSPVRETAVWRSLLAEAGRPNVVRRRIVFALCQMANLVRGARKDAVYDLVRDPLEDHPQDPRLLPWLRREYALQVGIMDHIDQQARPPLPVAETPGGDDTVQQRLRALGYIE